MAAWETWTFSSSVPTSDGRSSCGGAARRRSARLAGQTGPRARADQRAATRRRAAHRGAPAAGHPSCPRPRGRSPGHTDAAGRHRRRRRPTTARDAGRDNPGVGAGGAVGRLWSLRRALGAAGWQGGTSDRSAVPAAALRRVRQVGALGHCSDPPGHQAAWTSCHRCRNGLRGRFAGSRSADRTPSHWRLAGRARTLHVCAGRLSLTVRTPSRRLTRFGRAETLLPCRRTSQATGSQRPVHGSAALPERVGERRAGSRRHPQGRFRAPQ